jgi:signal transduction histidine kinase/CheY-like chemotaxis protein
MTSLHAPFAVPDVEDLPLAVWVGKAPDGEFLYANPAFFVLFGIPSGGPRPHVPPGGMEAAGNPCKVAAALRLPLRRAIAERSTVTVDDIVVERPDGSSANLRATARPMFRGGGNVTHVIVGLSEVRRDAFAISHERLRHAINHAPLVIFAVDRRGAFTLGEGSALAKLGISPGQLTGQSLFEVYRDHPGIVSNVKRALAGESFTDLVELGPLVFETWYAPIAGPEGGVLGVATDVTERRRMQATLLSAERMVAVGTIAASVAHEINNPLSYVIACIELLMRERQPIADLGATVAARYPEDPEVARLVAEIARAREPFDNIRDGVERMRLIARDLRTFARVDDHDLTPIDVREVLRSAIRMASNETRYRATLVTDFAPVPWVMASEPRLAQVFLNLLVNAAQAFPDEAFPGSCEIRVSTGIDGSGTVVVEVRDNGPGIDASVLPRIFEPFFTTKPVGVGTGLGLSVCRNIVRSYGGEIAASSELGQGSAFVVRLPAAAGPPPASSRRHPALPPQRRARVLVIDDDKVLGKAFRMTLEREFDVQIASSGAQAIEILGEEDGYDFVFCDLMMPEMSGMDVFAELSRRMPEVAAKVLFMTGGVYSPEVRTFIARVPNRCLQKPFDPAVVIREALARRK